MDRGGLRRRHTDSTCGHFITRDGNGGRKRTHLDEAWLI
jgi:hypothetical protein